MTEKRKAELFDNAIAWIYEHTGNYDTDLYMKTLINIGMDIDEITEHLKEEGLEDLIKDAIVLYNVGKY